MKHLSTEWLEMGLMQLVDHEFSEAEEREFLQAVESQNEWKSVAIALLESRLIAQVIREGSRNGSSTKSQTLNNRPEQPSAINGSSLHSSAVVNSSTVKSVIASQHSTTEAVMSAQSTGRKRSYLASARSWASIAVVMFVAFSAGWFARQTPAGFDHSRAVAEKLNTDYTSQLKDKVELFGASYTQHLAKMPLDSVDTYEDPFDPANELIDGSASQMASSDADYAEVMLKDFQANSKVEPVVLPVHLVTTADLENLRIQQLLDEQKIVEELASLLEANQQDVVKQDQWVEVVLDDGRKGLMPVSDVMVVARKPSLDSLPE